MNQESPHRQRILVTGASGFIGRSLVAYLNEKGHEVLAVSRSPMHAPAGVRIATVSSYHDGAVLTSLAHGIDTVVHLAAIAHRAPMRGPDGGGTFAWNVTDTTAMAMAAATAGVRRFILVSSIGVNGNQTDTRPFTEATPPRPSEPYAVSKWQAELALRWVVGKHPDMDFVILRPPLVYGPGAPGNFDRALRAVARGVPLPLGGISNQRSFVALGNLLSLIERCTWHPAARNELFLVSDGEDVSTVDFVRRIGRALGKPARVIWLPVELIRTFASLVGRAAQVKRLVASLQVDSRKAREQLGWSPPLTLDEGLRHAVKDLRAQGTP